VIGTTLSHYKITDLLGKGGMGEVYRATDTRLDRAVAIKLLPPQFTDHLELRQRFEHEAKALAGLSHPHICTLHDVGHEGGVHFLVMELVEGETVADRLAKGRLPVELALTVAIEIADALDVAHRSGIIHRDIKPSNLMLTKSGAKVLDFGLARPNSSPVPSPEQATEPTPLTAEGSIIGTLSHMAPEQVKGQATDARTDIFALGTVLYEALTCRRAFEGEGQAELIASILNTEPTSLRRRRPETPAALARAIERCLAKDPNDRWQSARDLVLELRWIASPESREVAPAAASNSRNWPLRVAWALAFVSLLTLAIVTLRPEPSVLRPGPSRLSVQLPESVRSPFVRVSPDGRWLTFSAISGGNSQLWLRSLDSVTSRPLDHTQGGQFPFWSPNSQRIGFFADGDLKVLDLGGGPPRVLCEVPGRFNMGTWGSDGTILYTVNEAPGQDGIYRVADSGGSPTRLRLEDEDGTELYGVWPSFLPESQQFFFVGFSMDDPEEFTAVLRIASTDDPRSQSLLDGRLFDSRVEFAPPGHLLYTRDGTLLAHPFDPGQLRFTAEPTTIAERIEEYGPVGLDNFSVSGNGVLAYQTEYARHSELQWRRRDGTTLGTIGEPGAYIDARLGPRGQQLAVSKTVDGVTDVWIYDLGRDVETRFSPSTGYSAMAAWSPDGTQLAFAMAVNAPPFLHVKPIELGDAEALLPSTGTLQLALDWSRNGRELLYGERHPEAGWDLWVLPMEGDRTPVPLHRSEYREGSGAFSPDGEWLAYSSDESGRSEIYLESYPSQRRRRRISTHGGTEPRWRADGRELFYLGPAGELLAVELSGDGNLDPGIPSTLFTLGLAPDAFNNYDVSADGQRFVVITPIPGGADPPTIMVNWQALIEEK